MSFIQIASVKSEDTMSIFTTKHRLARLVSASALVGTMAVAAVPAFAMAASPVCTPTGFVRDGINLTAARITGICLGCSRRDRLRHRCLQPEERHQR